MRNWTGALQKGAQGPVRGAHWTLAENEQQAKSKRARDEKRRNLRTVCGSVTAIHPHIYLQPPSSDRQSLSTVFTAKCQMLFSTRSQLVRALLCMWIYIDVEAFVHNEKISMLRFQNWPHWIGTPGASVTLLPGEICLKFGSRANVFHMTKGSKQRNATN